MIDIVNTSVLDFLRKFLEYLPVFFGGLVILLIGAVLASLLKRILITLFVFFKLGLLLEKMKLMERAEFKVWQEVLGEVLRWSVIILFLIPSLEVWGLSKATVVLNEFVLYLPNVIIAVIIGFVGLITSNLIADVVKHSLTTINSPSAGTLGMATKWVITFFTLLIVLNQLGVAQDLIRILFTGIVAMVALAGGLAFGLGGKDTASELLKELTKKIKSDTSHV